METQVAVSPVAAPFEAVVAPHYDGLVRRLAFIVGDAEEAKDLAQSAYLKALEAWPRFDGSDPRGWLYTIGINLAISELRRRRLWWRRRPSTEPIWALRVDPDLWQAIGELDAPQRAALLLNVMDGYTQAEIGDLLHVPPGTVASWLSRTKAQLRQRLGEER
jgi:RNA polymerase sigma-70 factor, ECF subfamily